jgi:hypothetical protein
MVYMKHSNGLIFTTEHPERHLTCSEKLTVKAGKAALKEQCITELKALVKPGSTVSTSLKNVSGSSVKREISFYIVDPRDNEITDIDYLVSIITDTRRANNGSLIVTGSERSLGYELVYHLSSMLWPMGTDTPHGIRKGMPDSTGGYALKHKCI